MHMLAAIQWIPCQLCPKVLMTAEEAVFSILRYPPHRMHADQYRQQFRPRQFTMMSAQLVMWVFKQVLECLPHLPEHSDQFLSHSTVGAGFLSCAATVATRVLLKSLEMQRPEQQQVTLKVIPLQERVQGRVREQVVLQQWIAPGLPR